MRHTGWVVAGLLVVGVAAVALWPQSRPSEPPSDLLAARPVERVPLGPLLEGSAGASARAVPANGAARIVGVVRRAGRPAVADVSAERVSSQVRRWGVGGGLEQVESLLRRDQPRASPHASVRSGEDGGFALPGLGAGTWQVRARASDGAFAETLVDFARAEGIETIHLDLLPAVHALTGRVLTTDGRPWGTSIAAVVPWGVDWNARPAAEAPIDGEGRFALARLTAGAYFLDVRGQAGVHVTVLGIRAPHGPLEIRVHPLTTEVTVRVVDARTRTPVPDARVLVTWMRGFVLYQVPGVADADGLVRLPAAPPADVFAFAPGRTSGSAKVGPGVTEVSVLLDPLGRVRGQVTRSGTGEPAPGLTVRVLRQDGATAVTDAEGRYAIDGVEAGPRTITAGGPGWVSVGLADADEEGWNPNEVIVAAGTEVACDLVVEPATRIEGRVLEADGRPAVEAAVGVVNLQPLQGVGLRREKDVRTDPDGRYAIDALPPGVDLSVSAKTRDGIGVSSPLLRTTPGVMTVDLRFPSTRSLDVRVVSSADAQPIAGASVESARPDTATVLTDAEGRARVRPAETGDEIEVEAEAHVAAKFRAPAEGEHLVRLARGVPLRGTVLLPDGTPGVGVRVMASREDVTSSAACWSDASGRFAWEGLAPGRWTVSAFLYQTPMLNGELEAEAGGPDVVIHLTTPALPEVEEGGVLVRVKSGGKEPVASGHVLLLRAGGQRHAELEGDEVRMDLPNTGPAKSFTVVVYGARDRDGATFGPAIVGPFTADRREIEVTLPPELAILGRVEGLPRGLERGVVVRAYPSPEASDWPRLLHLPVEDLEALDVPKDGVAQTRCATDGSFRVGGLLEMHFTLVALLPPGWIQEALVAARPGEVAAIRVRRGVEAVVTVLGPGGSPLPGAQVRVRFPYGGERPGEEALARAHQSVSDEATDGTGRARLRSLRPDALYRLEVQAGEEDEVFPYRTDRWTPADTVVRLRRAFVVEGVVRDRGGKPVGGAKVALWTDEEREYDSTDEEGRFRFEQLPEGTFRLRAARSEEELRGDPGPDAVTVTAGTRDVAFMLDPGVPLVLRGLGARASRFSLVVVYVRQGGRLHEVRDEVVSGEDGSVTLRGFEPGQPYLVWLPPQAQDPQYALVEVADVAAGPVHVSLQKGATLRLRREGSDEPVRPLFVNASSEAGPEFSGGSLVKDGSLPGMPPGTWTLHFRLGNEGDWTATVKVGTADMDVVLRPK